MSLTTDKPTLSVRRLARATNRSSAAKSTSRRGSHSRKRVRPTRPASLLVGLAMLLTLTLTACGADNTTTGAATSTMRPTSSTVSEVSPAQDRWLQMEVSGELHTMLQQHQVMMQQMQASASPQMLEIMRTDPMWQMLESGEAIKEMEQHQADINRMLAQPGP